MSDMHLFYPFCGKHCFEANSKFYHAYFGEGTPTIDSFLFLQIGYNEVNNKYGWVSQESIRQHFHTTEKKNDNGNGT